MDDDDDNDDKYYNYHQYYMKNIILKYDPECIIHG